MKFALFLGCTTPYHLKAYESSSRAVLEKLGVELVDIPQFNCCGYPLMNIDREASILASARNVALAQRDGLDLLVLCKCGYGTFKKATHLLDHHAPLQEKINVTLAKENLAYKPGTRIMHLLTVLHREVGLDAVKDSLVTSYSDLKIATHYGCHALRPSDIVKFDDPVSPTLFDDLVNITGAQSIDWENKLECCGGPLSDINNRLSLDLAGKKLAGAKEAEADFIVTACPFCQIRFQSYRNGASTKKDDPQQVPSVLYPQLLGLCLGLGKDRLGLIDGHPDQTDLKIFLTPM